MDNDVIILDEATSSLDSFNEAQIMNMINGEDSGKTFIFVSHRLSTVYKSDMIYVMENGSVVAAGKHDELKTECEPYKKLFKNQFKEVDAYENR